MTKLKAIKPKEAKPRKPKILIYGAPGVGKTWAALDFPNVYYIDTEGGATEHRYIEKLTSSGGVYLGVEEGSQDFPVIIEQVKALATEKHPYKTLVIDSLSKIWDLEITKEYEEITKPGGSYHKAKSTFGAEKKPAKAYFRSLLNWLEKIDMNVILICHEVPKWENDENVGKTFYGPDRLDYELSLCMHIKRIGQDNRKAYITKSRLEAFPEFSNFNWSYEEFASKYGKDTIESEVKQIELATPEQLDKFNALLENVKVEEKILAKWLKAGQVEEFKDMESSKLQGCIDYLINKTKGE